MGVELETPLQLFINKKDRHYNYRASFSVMRHFKNFAQNQSCLICNKDYMALKTSTKMEVNTNKYICPSEFSSFVWTREQIWYGKVTLVKIHWQILFNKFLCSVWTQIRCYSFCDKYSLPNKHCSWELSFQNYFWHKLLICQPIFKMFAAHFTTNVGLNVGWK